MPEQSKPWDDPEWKDEPFGHSIVQRHKWMIEAIEPVAIAFENLAEAKTISQQGSAFDDLSNAISDLQSWHPDWDYERGWIKGVTEPVD